VNGIPRYILGQCVGPLVFSLSVLTAIVWLTQSLQRIDLIVERGQTAAVFLVITLLILPSLLAVITPFALFAAVLYALHRMHSDSELVVMYAAGVSRLRLAAPLIGEALVVGPLPAQGAFPGIDPVALVVPLRFLFPAPEVEGGEGRFGLFDGGLQLGILPGGGVPAGLVGRDLLAAPCQQRFQVAQAVGEGGALTPQDVFRLGFHGEVGPGLAQGLREGREGLLVPGPLRFPRREPVLQRLPEQHAEDRRHHHPGGERGRRPG